MTAISKEKTFTQADRRGKPFINYKRYDFNKMAKENSFRDKKARCFRTLKHSNTRSIKEIDHNDLKKNRVFAVSNRSGADVSYVRDVWKQD